MFFVGTVYRLLCVILREQLAVPALSLSYFIFPLLLIEDLILFDVVDLIKISAQLRLNQYHSYHYHFHLLLTETRMELV